MEQTQTNKIGQNFNFKTLLQFVLPTMLTQFFLSVFKTVDDGLFVSRYVGTNALSAINILFPYMIITDAMTFIFASGASAVCSRKMGEGKQHEAMASFSSVAIMAVIFGSLVTVLSLIFQGPILKALGTTELLWDDAVSYSTYYWLINPIGILCPLFDFFYSTAGRPGMSVISSVTNGLVNIVCDYIFIVKLQLGVVGAAYSSGIGCLVFASIGFIFYTNKKHEIHFVKPWGHWWTLFKEMFSVGMAQFFNHIAIAASSYISNIVLLNMAGEDGLAVYSIVGYILYLTGSFMGGYADGVSSIFGFNYGAKNTERIKRYFKYSVWILFVGGAIIVAICMIFSHPLSSIYIKEAEQPEMFNLVVHALYISPLSILFSGFGMFASRFFAAMNNGKMAAFIAFMRNGVFMIATTLILPIFMGLDGIWWQGPLTEFLGFLTILGVLYIYRDAYGIGKSGLALKINN